MSAACDHLVARLEAMLASLEAGDAETVAAGMDAAVTAFAQTKDAGRDPRVLEAFERCQRKASALLASLTSELGVQATSRRAVDAYGRRP